MILHHHRRAFGLARALLAGILTMACLTQGASAQVTHAGINDRWGEIKALPWFSRGDFGADVFDLQLPPYPKMAPQNRIRICGNRLVGKLPPPYPDKLLLWCKEGAIPAPLEPFEHELKQLQLRGELDPAWFDHLRACPPLVVDWARTS